MFIRICVHAYVCNKKKKKKKRKRKRNKLFSANLILKKYAHIDIKKNIIFNKDIENYVFFKEKISK